MLYSFCSYISIPFSWLSSLSLGCRVSIQDQFAHLIIIGKFSSLTGFKIRPQEAICSKTKIDLKLKFSHHVFPIYFSLDFYFQPFKTRQNSSYGMLRHAYSRAVIFMCLQEFILPYLAYCLVCKPEVRRIAIRVISHVGQNNCFWWTDYH